MNWQRCCPPSRTCTPGKSSTRTSSRRTCCSKGGRRGVLEGGAFCSPTSVNQCWRIRRAAASRPWRRWRPLNVRHRLVSINPLPNQCHNMPQPLARSNIPIRHCVGLHRPAANGWRCRDPAQGLVAVPTRRRRCWPRPPAPGPAAQATEVTSEGATPPCVNSQTHVRVPILNDCLSRSRPTTLMNSSSSGQSPAGIRAG